VLRQFSGSHLPSLGHTPHIAVDSHGNIFVADFNGHCILLLDANLTLRRVIDERQLVNYKKLTYEPKRLCYIEQSGTGFKKPGLKKPNPVGFWILLGFRFYCVFRGFFNFNVQCGKKLG